MWAKKGAEVRIWVKVGVLCEEEDDGRRYGLCDFRVRNIGEKD